MVKINEERLIRRINELGQVGIDDEGRRVRLAADDAEKQGRDLVSGWMKDALFMKSALRAYRAGLFQRRSNLTS